MFPVLFEALAFFKTNRELWDGQDVIKAMSRRVSERVQQTIDMDMEHDF